MRSWQLLADFSSDFFYIPPVGLNNTSLPVVVVRSAGLYCPQGDFYIDPWEAVHRAVITHAHGDHACRGTAQYYAATPGVPLLRLRLDPGAVIEGLDYGEAIMLGGVKVSLHSAGHILGSAQVRLEADDGAGGTTVWVVSGDYKRGADPTCAPFQVVPCDVFITEATFAAPIYRWQSGPEIAGEILAWWRACQAQGSTALLFCYALGKAQRVLAELARLDGVPAEPVLLHGAMIQLTAAYRDAGVVMLPTEVLAEAPAAAGFAGRLVLAPPSAYRSPWMRRFRQFETGFASGWMRVRGVQRQKGHDRGFVLSDHADWPDLVRTVQETGARQTLVTHGRSDLLVRWLNEHGHPAAALSTAYGDESGNN